MRYFKCQACWRKTFHFRLLSESQCHDVSPATIDAYCYHVDRFENFLGTTTLHQVCPEDIRLFQLELLKVKKVGYSSFNQAVCGLRLFYKITLPRKWHVKMIPNLKHRTLFTTLYATGMRISEATDLRVADIDSQRMLINIQSGKGKKQRYVPLSPRLLEALRAYWNEYRPAQQLPKWQQPESPN